MAMICHCFLGAIVLITVSYLCYADEIVEADLAFEKCSKRELTTEGYEWNQLEKVTGEAMHFKVKILYDADILLTDGPSISNTLQYYICIGSEKNSKSVFYLNDEAGQTSLTPDLFNQNEFRSFWISWKNGLIELGKEGEKKPFLLWNATNPFNVTHYGLKTNYGLGEWVIYQEDKSLKRRPECRIYCQLKHDLLTKDDEFDFDKLKNLYFHKAKEWGFASIACGIEQCKHKKSQKPEQGMPNPEQNASANDVHDFSAVSKYTDKCEDIADKWRCIHSMIHAPGYIYFNSPEDNWNRRCYGSCILQSDGLLTEEGDFDFDAAKKHYGQMEQENNNISMKIAQSALDAIDHCGRGIPEYSTKCEAADWMYLCILGNV